MLLRLIKLCIATVYHYLARPFVWCFSKNRSRSNIVLFYHSIKPGEKAGFSRQMDRVSKKAVAVPLGFSGPFRKGARFVTVTFDDAFQSVIDNGVGAMIERDIPFAIMVPSGCLGSAPKWLAGTGHPDETETVATAESLLSIPKDSVTFGSHTVNHARLTSLSPAELVMELEKSKADLESALGRKIERIAFPFGAFNKDVLEATRKAGYAQAYTIEYETPYAPPDSFAKGRVDVSASDWPIEFSLKLAGSYAWMTQASGLKRSIRNMFRRKG